MNIFFEYVQRVLWCQAYYDDAMLVIVAAALGAGVAAGYLIGRSV